MMHQRFHQVLVPIQDAKSRRTGLQSIVNGIWQKFQGKKEGLKPYHFSDYLLHWLGGVAPDGSRPGLHFLLVVQAAINEEPPFAVPSATMMIWLPQWLYAHNPKPPAICS
jgi:hypothetical protein